MPCTPTPPVRWWRRCTTRPLCLPRQKTNNADTPLDLAVADGVSHHVMALLQGNSVLANDDEIYDGGQGALRTGGAREAAPEVKATKRSGRTRTCSLGFPHGRSGAPFQRQ